MSENVIIRNYRKSDFEATTRIMRELSKSYSFGFMEEKWKESSGLRLFSPGSARMTLIAEVQGEVVGMGFIEVKTEPTGEKMGYLSNWGVINRFHNRGVGRRFLDRAVVILEKMGVETIRINFAFEVSEKLLNYVKDQGVKPVSIAVEKVLKKNGITDTTEKQENSEQVVE